MRNAFMAEPCAEARRRSPLVFRLQVNRTHTTYCTPHDYLRSDIFYLGGGIVCAWGETQMSLFSFSYRFRYPQISKRSR